jgi:hypothetical protein
MRKTGNKRAVESILVATGNVALPAGGTSLIDVTTGTVNLASGQLVVIDGSAQGSNALNVALTAGDTVANSPLIRIVQGKANVDNMEASIQFPLEQRPYEISGDILGAGVVAYKGKAFAQSTRNAVLVGGVAAAADQINIEDNSQYDLNVAYRGRRVQEYDTSTHGSYFRKFSYTSPEYSTLGLTSSLDHLVQNLVYNVNRDSRQFNFNAPNFGANQPILALAIKTVGGAGTAINAVSGTVVPVLVTASGITKSITLDAELVATLADVVANGQLANTATIELVNLSTAGNAAKTDRILLVALNEIPAYVDRIPFLKIRLEVGLGGAFNNTTVLNSSDSPAFEGDGTYRQWKIYYDNTAGQRKYSQYRGFETLKIEVPSDLDSTKTYDAYIIEHFESHQLQLAGISNSPQKTIILVPSGDTVTSASLEAVLNPWMASTPGQFSAITL